MAGETLGNADERARASEDGAVTGFGAAGALRAEARRKQERPLGTPTTEQREEVGVPNGIRTRVLALKGPRPRPLDDGDAEERNTKSYHVTPVWFP